MHTLQMIASFELIRDVGARYSDGDKVIAFLIVNTGIGNAKRQIIIYIEIDGLFVLIVRRVLKKPIPFLLNVLKFQP